MPNRQQLRKGICFALKKARVEFRDGLYIVMRKCYIKGDPLWQVAGSPESDFETAHHRAIVLNQGGEAA